MLAGCGSSPENAASTGSSATTTPSTLAASSTTASTAPTTSTASTTSTTTAQVPAGQPGGGPVPAGFSPVSFTAVSANEYWLLGTAPCSNAVCTSIVRTTDGGQRFAGLPAPAVPLVGQGTPATTDAINTLRFADGQDGYAYATGQQGAFWATHDGGEHWAQPSFIAGHELLAFGTGGGYAFALVGSCDNGSCSGVDLERSPVGAQSWAALAVPVPAGVNALVSMTAHGASLWFSVTTAATQANQVLIVSTDSGGHFSTFASPCFSGLAGSIQASSADVLWAVCPTGMMAQALRSTDGGAHWTALSAAGGLENSAQIAPSSDSTAVLEPTDQGDLLRTTDGGASWTTVYSSNGTHWWSWLGFTDASTGSGLQVSNSATSSAGILSEQLWRTTDGGASWSGPVAF